MATKECIACSEEIQVSAKLCKHCGTTQDDERFHSGEIKPKSAPSRKGHICPVCDEGDSVASVASIIDSGTSNSTSLTMMNQFGHPLEMYSGVTVSSSSSVLAQRLTVNIPEAKFPYKWLAFGFGISFFLSQKIFSQPGSSANLGSDLFNNIIGPIFVSVIVGPLLGMILGFIFKSVEANKIVPQQQAAHSVNNTLRNSYYCSRDDVVFNDELSGSPQDFISKLLN